MKDKLHLYAEEFVKDVCTSYQCKKVRTTKTKQEKSVEKFNRRYGNSN